MRGLFLTTITQCKPYVLGVGVEPTNCLLMRQVADRLPYPGCAPLTGVEPACVHYPFIWFEARGDTRAYLLHYDMTDLGNG
jgi:hypothetical protein